VYVDCRDVRAQHSPGTLGRCACTTLQMCRLGGHDARISPSWSFLICAPSRVPSRLSSADQGGGMCGALVYGTPTQARRLCRCPGSASSAGAFPRLFRRRERRAGPSATSSQSVRLCANSWRPTQRSTDGLTILDARTGLGSGGVPQAWRLPVGPGPGRGVSEADDVLFGRAEMERAFTALGERLQRGGVVADVFQGLAAPSR
jgi:hypothetical protein